MKTKKYLGCLAALALTLHASAQVAWDTNGNTVAGADWFGADAGSTIPLRIRNDANQPIEWYTAAVRRILLSPTLVGQNVNGYTGLDLSGHLGLGNFTNLPGGPPPLTMIHLDNLGTEVAGYRPWMHTGVGMSDASEWMYVGMKREAADRQDAVINWSDNREVFSGGQFGPDALRMIFTSTPTTTSVSGSVNGLEIARLIPAVSGNEGFFGIGDYFTAGLQPVERLDILNGRLRIRELPLAANENANLLKYLVTDDNGVVFWRNVPTGGGGGSGCEWTLAPSQNRLYTATGAVGSNGNCPESDWKVGIGTNNTSGKLTVFENALTTGSEFALHVTMNGNTGNNTGHFLRVNDQLSGSLTNTGLDLEVLNGSVNTRGTFIRSVLETGRTSSLDVVCDDLVTTQNGTARDAFGSWARVNLGANSVTREAYGAYGIVRNYAASGGDSSNVKYMFGVYGEAMGVFDEERYGVYGKAANAPRSWAGYFAGKVYAQNGYFTSDAQLKTDIEELTNCNDVIAQLRPRKYNFNMAAWPGMGLPEGMQTGLIAQDLQEVLPHLVDMAHHPAEQDDEGNVTSEGVDFLAVNYIGLMPYLIGAIQEQHQEIAATEATNAALTDRLAEQDARLAAQDEVLSAMREELAQMREALAACCAATPGDPRLFTTPPANTPDDLNKALEGDARHLHIQPNPFTERTTLHYRLERAGRMQLLANSADGKALKVLQEATLEAGAYQYNWETNELTPGVYYITLLLDGEPLVKKAVKVMR